SGLSNRSLFTGLGAAFYSFHIPPLLQAVHHTFIPEKRSAVAIVAIVGGSAGRYITFSGAHRLMDAGDKGKDQIRQINRSAISGIIISTVIRFILFLAFVGVLSHGQAGWVYYEKNCTG